ncbi:ribonuclease E inhibitor RraB [Colwellia ponticola]|uniref:Ribonuclease E inhibitor RraB n=1 Tax=Colwellia ponticola TaxID=2304625 RepID=A0A8H2JPX5_9GAMM|nr:ribonuclease E inhibitor RraB [Colwellia ponticola]TMM47929.1 ribonuclease E inhibitor RraB [Colwellia ponticola]
MNYPDDETGQVLAEMHQAGIDLSQPHEVVFFHLFEKEAQAQAMVEYINVHLPDISCHLHPDETPNVWDVDCTLVMTPTHQAIIEQEEVFEKIVTQFSGYTDGWGIEA